MEPCPFLLRFEDIAEARAALSSAGIALAEEGRASCPGTAIPAFDGGMLHHLTGERVEFEGEPLTLSVVMPGFYILMDGRDGLPAALCAYIWREEWLDCCGSDDHAGCRL